MVLRRRRILDARHGRDHRAAQLRCASRSRTVVTLDVDADLADLFDVKQGHAEAAARDVAPDADGERLRLVRGDGSAWRGVEVRARGARINGYRARWAVDVDAGGSWSARAHCPLDAPQPRRAA